MSEQNILPINRKKPKFWIWLMVILIFIVLVVGVFYLTSLPKQQEQLSGETSAETSFETSQDFEGTNLEVVKNAIRDALGS